jgi:hypothetical protein
MPKHSDEDRECTGLKGWSTDNAKTAWEALAEAMAALGNQPQPQPNQATRREHLGG